MVQAHFILLTRDKDRLIVVNHIGSQGNDS